MYIKNAFVSKENMNIVGGSASVCLMQNIDDCAKMQQITKQLNLPISVFLKQTNEEHLFQVRYFIADGEEPICGHGTIVATQFLFDNNLIDKNTKEIKFELLFNNKKYNNNYSNEKKFINSYINNDFISLLINTKNINKILSEQKKDEIISSITNNEPILFNVKNIVEGEFDYTVEIEKINNKLNALRLIHLIQPNFNKIEKITLSNGKLCRGIELVIKNDDKLQSDFITRVFLPLGASDEYKEDPACGSATAYITQYLYEEYRIKNELSFFQASKNGAFIKAQVQENNKVLISGLCK